MSASPAFLDVRSILEPRSVAVIGASDQPGLGGDTVRRLVRFKFPGKVWPINRSAKTVADLPCHASVSELPEVPELAIFAIPAQSLLAAIRECVEFGVRAGIAYAGGLAESGGEGALLQREIVAYCQAHGFMLCGPNCVGVINATTPVTATFATALHEVLTLLPGVISMVCQSGGIATTSFSMAQQAGFGFRYLVSSGNEAVVNYADYLYAFARDPGTKIIGGYIEGITDAPKFVRALEEARRQGKPVVLIKAGMTGATARAALAHTGALVGEDRVIDAVLKELGVMRVHSVEELVDVMLMLAGNTGKAALGPGVGVITFGGGNGVLAADQCGQNGLTTPELGQDSSARLRPLLVSVASAANPLDLTPTTAFRAEALAQLPQALEVFERAPELHSLLFIVGSLASKASEIIEVICGLAERAGKPVCVSWPSPPRGVPERLAERGIYSFIDPARAIRALSKMVASHAAAQRPERPSSRSLDAFDWAAHVSTASAQAVIPEHVCHRILAGAGLPVAAGTLARDEDGALRAAGALGLPVVLKGVSPTITHRAKAGLVAVDLRSLDEVRAAFQRFAARARALGVPLEGVYVQKMQSRGAELLVTAFRDPMFGVMVSCGSGGVLTETIDDVVTERAPVGVELARHMLERLRIRNQARDAEGLIDTDAVAQFIARFADLALTAPWPRFTFEVNPVLWRRDGAVAVDGLLVIG